MEKRLLLLLINNSLLPSRFICPWFSYFFYVQSSETHTEEDETTLSGNKLF